MAGLGGRDEDEKEKSCFEKIYFVLEKLTLSAHSKHPVSHGPFVSKNGFLQDCTVRQEAMHSVYGVDFT